MDANGAVHEPYCNQNKKQKTLPGFVIVLAKENGARF